MRWVKYSGWRVGGSRWWVGVWVFLWVTGLGAGEVPRVVAFGSCAKETLEQPIWEAVLAKRPGVFVFLGDNIYGDTDDMAVMRAKYARLGEQPGFRRLRMACRVLATWDDHDYGRNDAGAEYEWKRESQRELLRFFGEPEGSERWRREGVYGDWLFDGGEGRRLQVVLLDTRYFRSPLARVAAAERAMNFGPYGRRRGDGVTMLGEAQWAWLGRVLREPADVRLIGTSIQAVPDGHGWEKWGNFPDERARLFRLVRESGAGGVVLLSGDRHLGEISCLAADAPGLGVGYPLYEVTSSGLTQAGGGKAGEPNEWRVGEMYRVRNFGTVAIDWEERVIELGLWDEAGEALATVAVGIDALSGGGE